MRYAVFSDVHSNLEAFEAACEDFEKCSIDKFLFGGDIVGYGADPHECLMRLKSLDPECVAGNHDWAVAGLIDTLDFNDMAAQAIAWTQEKMTAADRAFLSDLQLVKKGSSWCLVHGTLNNPQEFNYMIDERAAVETFSLLNEQVCFVGHSHFPGIFIQAQGKTFYCQDKEVILQKDRRYIVNVGSVGQPRDGDKRACFCVYDDSDGSLEFRRVSYDAEQARTKIIENGLPKGLGDRLLVGR